MSDTRDSETSTAMSEITSWAKGNYTIVLEKYMTAIDQTQ